MDLGFCEVSTLLYQVKSSFFSSEMLMRAVSVALVIASAIAQDAGYAPCPNSCSGHGNCDNPDRQVRNLESLPNITTTELWVFVLTSLEALGAYQVCLRVFFRLFSRRRWDLSRQWLLRSVPLFQQLGRQPWRERPFA